MKKIILTLYLTSIFSANIFASEAKDDRKLWVDNLHKIAYPILSNLAHGNLKSKMPVVNQDRAQYQNLEAFGRLICGIAPWVELGADTTDEGILRSNYINLIRKCFVQGLDYNSNDYFNFNEGMQPLVDAAYLAQGLIRAPNFIWGQLDKKTQFKLIKSLKETRHIRPANNNWLLFASIIEACILKYDGSCDEKRLLVGLNTFYYDWYLGDGFYSDGYEFSFDHYNGFVIHPMLTDILNVLVLKKYNNMEYNNMLKSQLKRAMRYSSFQERLISPEGYYPIYGRTMICRMGVFHSLAQNILFSNIPKDISLAQLRNATTKVLSNQMSAPQNFDENGFLTVGFTGNQPSIAENYISTGSAYHCMTFFLPLGLPAEHTFWQNDNSGEEWTSVKAWQGQDIKADHSYHERPSILLKIIKKISIGQRDFLFRAAISIQVLLNIILIIALVLFLKKKLTFKSKV